jgi:hypothetical protein
LIRLGTAGRTRKLALVEASPLCAADPRARLALWLLRNPENLLVVALAGTLGHLGKFLVKWGLAFLAGAPVGTLALGLARAILGYVIFGALGGLLGGLMLAALRRAGFFAYLAEKR